MMNYWLSIRLTADEASALLQDEHIYTLWPIMSACVRKWFSYEEKQTPLSFIAFLPVFTLFFSDWRNAHLRRSILGINGSWKMVFWWKCAAWSAHVRWFWWPLALWLEGVKCLFSTQSENYCTAQGKHGGYRVRRREPCGSLMIHFEAKWVQSDWMISSMCIVEVS